LAKLTRRRSSGDGNQKRGPRIFLGILALVIAVLAFARAFDNVETSSVTATTYAGAAPTPTPSATPSATPSPSAITGTVITATKTSASDAVEVALIGFAGLFILLAILYNRVTSITGPGIALGLSPIQKHAGVKAAAKAVAQRAASIKPPSDDPDIRIERLAPLGRLPVMALRDEKFSAEVIESSTEHLTETTARVTELTLASADHLMRLRNAPDVLEEEAMQLGITHAPDIDALKRGTVTTSVWQVLAEHSLSVVGVPSA
jgi:hypothetical protein